MLRQTETAEVYTALIASFADNIRPTLTMGATFVAVGVYGYIQSGIFGVLAVTVCGGLASVAKALLILYHRRNLGVGTPDAGTARRYENAHVVTTWCMAGSVGALTALLFSLHDLSLHLVATAILFGYGAGVATRISGSPIIAMGAVLLAAGPGIASAAMFNEGARVLTGLVFVVFLVSAIETIQHLHRCATRLITMRLQMEKLARLDPLTQLLNRLGLREAFNGQSPEKGRSLAVHVFDLDGFKAVNDRYGHAVGDRLLEDIAERLRDVAGEGDIVARIGGDEFVVVQHGLDGADDAKAHALRIHGRLTEPYETETGQPIRIGLSIGYSTAPSRIASLDELMRQADAASYMAKRSGGGYRAHQNAPSTQPSQARTSVRERSFV